MFDNLSVSNKFLAVTALPVNMLVAIALWAAVVARERQLAALVAIVAALTLLVAHRIGATTASRILAIGTEVRDVDAGGELLVGPEPEDGHNGDEIAQAERQVKALTRGIEDRIATARSQSACRIDSLLGGFSDRFQGLIDSQLGHLDWLQDTEKDGDRLARLFELDHLANRLRRSSDSIKVLAGVEITPKRRQPAPIVDVLRAAIGYNTRYLDIDLRSVDHVLIAADAAWESAHLVSELLENATRYSPEGKPVEVYATSLDDGSYRVTVIDRGCGMSDEQLQMARSTINNPPALEHLDGNSVGLHVVGLLAARLSASLELSATAGSGLTVELLLPASVVADGARQKSQDREALGDGGDFDAEVDGLVDEREKEATEPWVQPDVAGRAKAEALGLTRRKRGSRPPRRGPGEPALRTSTRKPEEVREMISQYRDGLQAGGVQEAGCDDEG